VTRLREWLASSRLARLAKSRRAGAATPPGLRSAALHFATASHRPVRIALCLLLLAPLVVIADQYQSEVRELPGTPRKQAPPDPKQLLEQTTDPYARALLLRDLAAQAIENKDYALASKYLKEAINQNSLSPQALAQMRKDLTQLLVAGGDPDDVIKALEPQVRNNAQAPAEQQAALAGAYLQVKRFKDALPLLQRAVASNPNPDESWLQALYAAHIGLSQEKEALPVLERLVRKNPGRREYWLQLAGLHHKAGQKERALAVLELASRQGHLQDAEERLQLVSLAAQLGAPFEAGSLMQRWMDDGQIPRTPQNLEALAGFWVAAREPQLAIAALRDKVADAPQGEDLLQLGQLYLQRGQNKEAASALSDAANRGARSGPSLLALAVASYNAGDFDGAVAAFSSAQKFAASAQSASQWLEFLESPQAREQAAKLAQKKPPPAQEIALSGRLLGETVKAAPALADIQAVRPDLRTIGGRLTPVGAERDANADGTIPEWTGGITAPPPGFKPGERLVDPYPDDKPLFTITAANVQQYASRLSIGHRALLAKYPQFRMPVYATRRSASYPQEIYDATQANLGKAKLIGSDALTNARLGFPFPQPQNGVEVMWNHRVRYRGNSFHGMTTQAVVGPEGVSNQRKGVFRVLFRYANTKDPANIDKENILVYGVTFVGERVTDTSAEFVVLFHETANSMKKSRGIWVLLGDIGRMLRLPPLGYDQVMYGTEGLYFIDMIDMYNGAFDRYVWKLIGKRELYIPYNAYRLQDGRQKYAQQLAYPVFSPEHARYELHRVWVIEATERGGKKHAFGKRIFYVDEDSWNAVLVENQDHQGNLWRFQEGHLLTSYDVLSTNSFPIITYDVKADRYFAQRLLAEDPPLQFDLAKINAQEFLPAAVQRKYGR
jgi:tetratricopeptide (TPR) repeat protein